MVIKNLLKSILSLIILIALFVIGYKFLFHKNIILTCDGEKTITRVIGKNEYSHKENIVSTLKIEIQDNPFGSKFVLVNFDNDYFSSYQNNGAGFNLTKDEIWFSRQSDNSNNDNLPSLKSEFLFNRNTKFVELKKIMEKFNPYYQSETVIKSKCEFSKPF